MGINFAQVAATGRHVLTFSAGAVTALGTIGIMTPADAQSAQHLINSLTSTGIEFAAFAGPMVGGISAWYAAWTASHKSQVLAVKEAVATGSIKGVQISGTPVSGGSL